MPLFQCFLFLVQSAAVYKFLHLLKETHYNYESIQINQNSLNTNKMDNFGAQALQTAEVLGDTKFVDLEKMGNMDVAKSRGLDTKQTSRPMLLYLWFLTPWTNILFQSNNPWCLPIIYLTVCYHLPNYAYFLFAALFKIPQLMQLQNMSQQLWTRCVCATPPMHLQMNFLRKMLCFLKLFPI